MAHHPIAGSIFGLGRSPGVGKWQPTPVFLPGKSDGQSSLVGYSPWGCQRVGHDWAHTHTSSYKALPQQNDPSLTLWGQLWFTNKTGIFFFFFLLFLWHIQWTIAIFIKVLAFSVTQLPNAVLLSYYFILRDFLVCKKELFKSFCQGWAQLDNQSLGNCA